jgi:hypothetical protein
VEGVKQDAAGRSVYLFDIGERFIPGIEQKLLETVDDFNIEHHIVVFRYFRHFSHAFFALLEKRAFVGGSLGEHSRPGTVDGPADHASASMPY